MANPLIFWLLYAGSVARAVNVRGRRASMPLATIPVMDLNDFGTDCLPDNRSSAGYEYSNGDGRPPPPRIARPMQWKIAQSGVFEACGRTAAQLPPGAYACALEQFGQTQFHARDLQVDDLIDF